MMMTMMMMMVWCLLLLLLASGLLGLSFSPPRHQRPLYASSLSSLSSRVTTNLGGSTTTRTTTTTLEEIRAGERCTASTNETNNKEQLQLPYDLHLFSLQWPSSLETTTAANSNAAKKKHHQHHHHVPFYSKATSDLWKWKDTVLGDGRDFFIPRPRTLQALQHYLLLTLNDDDDDDDDDETIQWEECMILSNCARLEIFLVTTTKANDKKDDKFTSSVTSNKRQAERIEQRLSRRLMAQCRAFYQQQGSNPFAWTNLPFDRPTNIVLDAPLLLENDDNVIDALLWTHLDEPAAICRHMCQVAAGLAPRPSRPNRAVIFRPFSSRDAHILLQLKRTVTTTTALDATSGRLGYVLRTALQAGKAARNVQRVPALQQLRPYGTGDSSYSSPPPTALMERVKKAAMQDAVEPAVQNYLESLQAEAASWQICALREEALAMACNGAETALVKQALHAPTIALRKGQAIDQRAFLQTLRETLDHTQ